ncbi:MAG: hypothetical protein EBT20_08120 [Alphaproteobacteria bacterium]|nr:hypothetical protein [Alphaproteobacteria bacterium]
MVFLGLAVILHLFVQIDRLGWSPIFEALLSHVCPSGTSPDNSLRRDALNKHLAKAITPQEDLLLESLSSRWNA